MLLYYSTPIILLCIHSLSSDQGISINNIDGEIPIGHEELYVIGISDSGEFGRLRRVDRGRAGGETPAGRRDACASEKGAVGDVSRCLQGDVNQ